MHHTKYPKDRSCLNTQAGNLGPPTNEGETEAGLCAPGCTAGLESTDRAGITGSNLTQVYLPTTPGVPPPRFSAPHTLLQGGLGVQSTQCSASALGALLSPGRPAPPLSVFVCRGIDEALETAIVPRKGCTAPSPPRQPPDTPFQNVEDMGLWHTHPHSSLRWEGTG